MAEGHGRLGKRVRGPNFVYRRSKFKQKKREKEEKEKEFKQRMRRGGSLTDKEWDDWLSKDKPPPKVRKVGKGYVTAKSRTYGKPGPIESIERYEARDKRKQQRKVGKGYVISKNRSKKK